MLHEQFRAEIARLIGAFGKAAFTPERVEIIHRACNDLTSVEMNTVVGYFLSTFRQAPLPKDFFEAAARERYRRRDSSYRVEYPPEPIRCHFCNDGGVLEVEGLQSRIEYFMRCTCPEGRLSIHRDLPMWSTPEHEPHFKVHVMFGDRAIRWKPARGFDPDAPADSLREKVNQWQFKLNMSRKYWREHAGSPPPRGDGGEGGA